MTDPECELYRLARRYVQLLDAEREVASELNRRLKEGHAITVLSGGRRSSELALDDLRAYLDHWLTLAALGRDDGVVG